MSDFEFFNLGKEAAGHIDANRQRATALVFATTGKHLADGSWIVPDTGAASHVWVKINDNEAETKSVLNKKTGVDRFKPGVGVWLAWLEDERIYEVDSVAGPAKQSGIPDELLSSAESPSQAGDTRTDTTPNALIKNLRVRVYLDPTALTYGMVVYIEAGYFYVGTTQFYWPGGPLDLTSALPSGAGMKAPVIIGINSATLTAVAYKGTEVVQSLPPVGSPYFMGADFAVARNAATGFDAALFGIGLLYGQTAVTNQADFVDLRAEQTSGAGGGGGTVDTLTAADRGLSVDDTDPANLLIATRPTDLDNANTLVRLDATLNEDVRPLRLSVGAKHVRLEDMVGMGDPDVTNPVVALGTSLQSDYKIREIGNVLYEPWEATRKYKLTYTGWKTVEDVDEKVHYVYSEDGKTWTKYASNPIISNRSEDPYVVKVDGVYYLFCEDKQTEVPNVDAHIRRYHSTDFTSWTDDGQIQGLGGNEASPVVWYDGGRWYLIYEHYPASPRQIYIAYSDDGLNFTPDTAHNPILSAAQTTATWCVDTTVPDDILKIGEQWVMSFHGQGADTVWREGLAFSRDLIHWIDSPHSPLPDYVAGIHTDTMMFLYDTALTLFYEDDNLSGIYRGFPVLADSTAKTLSSDTLTIDKDFHVVSAQTGTTDNLATISGGKKGQLLALRAASGHTITAKTGTGNLKFGDGDDIVVSGDKTLFLYFDGTTWYDVGGTGSVDPATIHASDLATRWEPLIFDSEIVFYDGDIIMVEVSN